MVITHLVQIVQAYQMAALKLMPVVSAVVMKQILITVMIAQKVMMPVVYAAVLQHRSQAALLN